MKTHSGESVGQALIAGSFAGLSVDLSLFPLDTVKTRLQSPQGFLKAGGFRGIYSGLGSAAVGSMPGAALFFCTYESVKAVTRAHVPEHLVFTTHMAAACCGEVAACIVRVPCEVVKQRAQASQRTSSLSVLTNTIRQEGAFGLYRGYFSTLVREIPFSFIQFPLWEFFKVSWASRQGGDLAPWQSAVCGAAAGATGAAATTPLDVAKTRIMLAQHGSELARGNIVFALKVVMQEKGFRGLFAGLLPRVLWISVGGAIFLGVYDKARQVLGTTFPPRDHGDR